MSSIQELAELVLIRADKINNIEIKQVVNQLVDYCLQVQSVNDCFILNFESKVKSIQQQFQCHLNEQTQKSQSQNEQLIQSLHQKNTELSSLKRWSKRSFEKLELGLYEKNNFPTLKNLIEEVQSYKKSIDKKLVNHSSDVSFQSLARQTKENECNQAFCHNQLGGSQTIMNNTNNIIVQDNNLQQIIDMINRSSLSINKKEQIYFKLLKSNPPSQQNSQLQHVQLQELLDVSNNPKSQVDASSFLQDQSQNIIKKHTNTNQFQKNQKGKSSFIQLSPIRATKHDQSSLLILDEFLTNQEAKQTLKLDLTSPKFLLAEISPIKQDIDLPLQMDQSNQLWIDSFRQPQQSMQKDTSSISVFNSIQQKINQSSNAKQQQQSQGQFFSNDILVSGFKVEPNIQRNISARLSSSNKRPSYYFPQKNEQANSFYMNNLINRINRSKQQVGQSVLSKKQLFSEPEENSKSFSVKLTTQYEQTQKPKSQDQSDKPKLIEKKLLYQMIQNMSLNNKSILRRRNQGGESLCDFSKLNQNQE